MNENCVNGTSAPECGISSHNKVRRCPGVYLAGRLQDCDVWFTVDTGASKTVISKAVYDRMKIQPSVRPRRGRPIEQAAGNPLIEHGIATFKFDFGTLQIEQDATVSNIIDDVLLGMDMGNQPLDVISSQNKVVVNGIDVPCVVVEEDSIRKVTCNNKYIVPPYSEHIVIETLNGIECDTSASLIIEPIPEFAANTGLVMASSLHGGRSVRVIVTGNAKCYALFRQLRVIVTL